MSGRRKESNFLYDGDAPTVLNVVIISLLATFCLTVLALGGAKLAVEYKKEQANKNEYRQISVSDLTNARERDSWSKQTEKQPTSKIEAEKPLASSSQDIYHPSESRPTEESVKN